MDRNTDLRNMDAPGVGSGKEAKETMLKGEATFPLPSEKGGNSLEEYTTEKQPVSGATGRAKH
jgi:hypothetical protein